MTSSGKTLLRLLAWTVLLSIVLATLVPIQLRPESGLSVQYERLLAFTVVGLLLAVAYPRHILVIAVVVLGVAVVLEVLQLVTPSRHGRIFDVGVKLVGGCAGIVAGWATERLYILRKTARSQRSESS